MALGKGLSSLIGDRDQHSAEDVLERIDNMEEEETTISITKTTSPKKEPMPAKPLVTPIKIDFEDEKPEQKNVTMLTPEQTPEIEEEVITSPGFGEAMGVGNVWDKHEEHVEHIAIGDIRINPLQPRRQFDPAEMEELKDSVDKHGILQPLVVRRLADGQGYELIAGERRLRAAKSLNWERVPCVIRRDVKSDQSRLVFALVENIQRENLNSIEEAMAYRMLNEEYGLTHEEIGERVGKSRVGITNAVRVLQLPAEIQRGIIESKITMGHARAILMIPDEEKQIRFYRHLLDEGLTVRKAEIRARRIQRNLGVNDPMRKKRRREVHPMSVRYSPSLEEHYGYGAKVHFDQEKNRFEVRFTAHSEPELEELVGRLLGTENLPESNLDEDVLED